MAKLTFLNALPPVARQIALAEINQILQAKHGNSYSISEQDYENYEAGTTKQKQEPTDEEISNLLNSIM
jgi:hypothetical protein